jgi:DNA-binding NarL/FixJ family response regulator
LTVLIVDDHDAFRARARRLLEAEGFDVVGDAGDGAQSLDAARRHEPQMVLIDVNLPDMNGFELADRLHDLDPDAALILTSTHDANDFGPLVERSVALGFVPKEDLSGAAIERLLEAHEPRTQ